MAKRATDTLRWRVISEAVRDEVSRHGDHRAAVKAVAESMRTTPGEISRALKCDIYATRHGFGGDSTASQTNIEMLMSMENVDIATADLHRLPILKGEMTYNDIRTSLDAARRTKRNGGYHAVSMDDVRRGILKAFPSLAQTGRKIASSIDPSWIDADMRAGLVGTSGVILEWVAIASPTFGGSCLYGRGAPGLVKAVACAAALCDVVTVVVASADEYSWFDERIPKIGKKSAAMITLHLHGSGVESIYRLDEKIISSLKR